MRASIGTTRASFRPTSAAITAARASPVVAFSTVCSARTADGIVDARQRRHRGLHARARRSAAAALAAAARPRAVPILPEHAGDLALHEPFRRLERAGERRDGRRARA